MKKLLDCTKPDALSLFTAEALEVHRQLDRIGVPRKVRGEAQTISQRVQYAVDKIAGVEGAQPWRDRY